MRTYFGSLVLSILSRWLIQFCLYLSLTSCIPEISSSCLMSLLLILSSLVYPVTLLRKRISAASRRVISLSVVTHGMQVKISTEEWCNDTDWRKPKYAKETLSQCHPLHHKCHKDWPGIETGPLLLVCKYVSIYCIYTLCTSQSPYPLKGLTGYNYLRK